MKDSQRKAMFAKNHLISIQKNNDFFKSPVAETKCRICGKKTTHEFSHECVGCGVKRVNETKCVFCGNKYLNHNEKHEFVGSR